MRPEKFSKIFSFGGGYVCFFLLCHLLERGFSALQPEMLSRPNLYRQGGAGYNGSGYSPKTSCSHQVLLAAAHPAKSIKIRQNLAKFGCAHLGCTLPRPLTIADPEKCFQEMLWEISLILLQDRPCPELIIVSSNFRGLLFLQDKLLASV